MTVCVICQEAERLVEPGWLVCSRDYWRLSNALRAIPDLVAEIQSLGYVQRDYRGEHGFAAVDRHGQRLPHFDQIAHALPAGPVNGRTGAPRVSGSNGTPLPIRVDPTDLTAAVRPASTAVHARSPWPADQIGWLSVATELDFWATDWATARNELRPSPQVPLLCSWLADRLDWATSDHQAGTVALEEFAAKVSSLYGALMSAVGGWAARPETLITPCRSCGMLALYREIGPADGSDRVACGACPALLTESDYAEWVTELTERQRAASQPEEAA